MPRKDAARTSTLSMTWRWAWNSLPKSGFRFSSRSSYYSFVLEEEKAEFVEETEQFIKSVDEALLPLREQKKIIRRFSLTMNLCDATYDSCIDNWIELVNGNHIETLDLDILSMIHEKNYVLPQKTFSVESLVKLSLSGCKLESDYLSHNMKPICLRELTLRFVEIDSHTIMKILRCCPLLEVWDRVEAPNLEVFHCERFIGKLDNIACSKVKKLKLKSVESKQISIPDINYKFPFLETLYLRVLRSEKIKISSRGLKRLSLSCDDQIMPLLQINCENLHSFEFDSESIPKSFSITSSACLEKIVHTLWPKGFIDTFWFLRLRRYLGKFNEHQTLSLHFQLTTNNFTSEELVPIVKHFVLDDVPTMQDYTAVLDGLLWSCHPKVLQTYSNIENNEFIKFLFQALVNRDDEPNCCSESHMKFWRHYLKAVTANYFDRRKRNWIPESGEHFYLM
uniref:F-box/LRR-repeat protein 15/At3g58940/PEG3-like LRR domain-containing protein n=1 Tax=Quercus lobata TaxID=97700 RepID=A0A7N2LP20_QUELO